MYTHTRTHTRTTRTTHHTTHTPQTRRLFSAHSFHALSPLAPAAASKTRSPLHEEKPRRAAAAATANANAEEEEEDEALEHISDRQGSSSLSPSPSPSPPPSLSLPRSAYCTTIAHHGQTENPTSPVVAERDNDDFARGRALCFLSPCVAPSAARRSFHPWPRQRVIALRWYSSARLRMSTGQPAEEERARRKKEKPLGAPLWPALFSPPRARRLPPLSTGCAAQARAVVAIGRRPPPDCRAAPALLGRPACAALRVTALRRCSSAEPSSPSKTRGAR